MNWPIIIKERNEKEGQKVKGQQGNALSEMWFKTIKVYVFDTQKKIFHKNKRLWGIRKNIRTCACWKVHVGSENM